MDIEHLPNQKYNTPRSSYHQSQQPCHVFTGQHGPTCWFFSMFNSLFYSDGCRRHVSEIIDGNITNGVIKDDVWTDTSRLDNVCKKKPKKPTKKELLQFLSHIIRGRLSNDPKSVSLPMFNQRTKPLFVVSGGFALSTLLQVLNLLGVTEKQKGYVVLPPKVLESLNVKLFEKKVTINTRFVIVSNPSKVFGDKLSAGNFQLKSSDDRLPTSITFHGVRYLLDSCVVNFSTGFATSHFAACSFCEGIPVVISFDGETYHFDWLSINKSTRFKADQFDNIHKNSEIYYSYIIYTKEILCTEYSNLLSGEYKYNDIVSTLKSMYPVIKDVTQYEKTEKTDYIKFKSIVYSSYPEYKYNYNTPGEYKLNPPDNMLLVKQNVLNPTKQMIAMYFDFVSKPTKKKEIVSNNTKRRKIAWAEKHI